MSSTSEYRSRPEVRLRAKESDRKYREANRAEINARARAREAAKKGRAPDQCAHPNQPKSDAEERADIRAYLLKKKYGLAVEEWNELLARQGGRCAICRTPNDADRIGWQTDHCHSTGKVRGLLCRRCNVVLGQVKEDTSLMQNMIDYIRTHNG